jgi:hypothetical protein
VQGRFTSTDPLLITFSRIIDPQQLNQYAYVRGNPLKYHDPDGKDLRLARGLKPAEQERIIKMAVKTYQKESGRAALERLEKSDVQYELGKGKIRTDVNLVAGVTSDSYGRVEKKGFDGITDPNDPKKVTYVDRKSGVVTIILDLEKQDNAQRAYESGAGPKPEPMQDVFEHEIGHANDIDNDMVREWNQSDKDAEKNAEALRKAIDRESSTMDSKKAEKRVREILGLPPKEEKKKK